MSVPASPIAQYLDWLDQASGDLVLLNPVDLPAMARFLTELRQQAKEWDSTLADTRLPPETPDTLRHASDLVAGVVMGKESNVTAAMATVGQMLENIRAVLRQHAPASDDAPGRTPDAPPSSGTAPADASGMSWLDDSIVAAYVEQQQTVLPEMEQLVLAFEKSRDVGVVPALRRIIHTLKGESGAVGAMDVEKVCHRFEDYLDGQANAIATDVLLAALDWIGRSVAAFGTGATTEGTEEMIAQFLPPPVPAAPPPPPASPSAPIPPVLPSEEPDDSNPMSPVKIVDAELAGDFLGEALEHFEIADENLLILEKDPDHVESIGAVFRAFHTLKGVAGFLGLTPICSLAHAAETLLDAVRKGQRAFSGPAVELTFNSLDMLKLMMADLRVCLQGDGIMRARPELPALLGKLHDLLGTAPVAPARLAAAPVAEGDHEEHDPESAQPYESAEPIPRAHSAHAPTQTMKVDAARIDQLLDMIGELVIIESIVAGDPEIRSLHSLRIEKNLALLGKITRSLRDMGMSMRMVPVDPVFKKMGRLVRDLSRKSGKQVELVIKGGDTEIDKGMVEKLGDPLVHMIRNSVDHGIEPAAERRAAGKTPQGRIELRAHHVGGNIHIDIEDDGRGLNREAIVQRGIERGLIQNPDGMSDQDVYALIFHPGFSTAKQITEISGRGVGMDVVKRNIESLRGNVLIRTDPGKGSLFTLVLPLTTAIIDGMLVRVGAETHIMPTLSILESFRPDPGQVHAVVGQGEMVSFRGSLLPMFRLSRLLDVPHACEDPRQAIVMVVEEYGKQWGLMVDDLLGQQQIVIKSLGEGLGRTEGVVGASILADGRPGLILDLADIIRIAKGE